MFEAQWRGRPVAVKVYTSLIYHPCKMLGLLLQSCLSVRRPVSEA